MTIPVGPDHDTRHREGHEVPRFCYHCIIQSPVEPLTTYEMVLTGPDQSQGQAALSEAVELAWAHYTGHADPGHLCYVAFAVHPDGSQHWEACKRCNELIGAPNEENMQYVFEDDEHGVRVYHDGADCGPGGPRRIA